MGEYVYVYRESVCVCVCVKERENVKTFTYVFITNFIKKFYQRESEKIQFKVCTQSEDRNRISIVLRDCFYFFAFRARFIYFYFFRPINSTVWINFRPNFYHGNAVKVSQILGPYIYTYIYT
jgi:hypothetical protein